MNLHQPMNWARLAPGQSDRYAAQPFSDPQHALSEVDVNAIRSAGFDFVRLTIDPGPFLQLTDKDLANLDDLLLARVQQLLRANLTVIVDFHPNPQVKAYAPDAFVGRGDPDVPRAHLQMLQRLAPRLAALDRCHVLLEPLNEPPSAANAKGAADWQAELEAQYSAVRAVAPQLRLVLPGGQAGWISGLVRLDPRPFRADRNVLYTFHYYFPFEFTNQSNPAMPWVAPLAELRYPARRTSLVESLNESRRRLARSKLSAQDQRRELMRAARIATAYWRSGFGPATISRDFEQVAAWARRNGVAPDQILLGEFGVVRNDGPYAGAADPDREAWLTDVRREAERRGYSWAIWQYRGTGGMGIAEATRGYDIDPMVVRALGLRLVKSPPAGDQARASTSR
ncbi:glycoside hydrolase family 5 protein [Phenylobacterium soli]|uniref:glycoside hydrolase family 5 protein n=1 Tax=Phenylobacterium soli TaxID=2170551 RepID=UPI001401E75A|nr:cellulase family glycosylhydrolase [Phenylobacterium soli]